MDIKYIIEPLLLTSLLLLPISFLYLHKKYYLIATAIFINGIASYIYHLKQNNNIWNEKPEEKSEEQFNKISYKKSYIVDIISTCISFILSLYLAKDLPKKQKYNLSLIVIITLFFYGLNYYYHSYNYHLVWHTFVLIGQLFLALNIKSNNK